MSKFLLLLMLIFLSLIPFSISASEDHMMIDIEVNGTKIHTDSAPFIERGTVYVPIRAISESLNLSCDWSSSDRYALIEDDYNTLRFLPDKNLCFVNGKKQVLKTHIKKGRIMVPVRFVSENFSSDVSWDDKYYRVLIENDDVSVPSHLKDKTYNQDEVYWLSRIINAEAGGESEKGLIAVGNVVLNRVKSKLFPNTIYGVIFDKKGGVQFEPVINGSIYKAPSHKSISAAKKALSGVNTAGKSLYFLNPRIAQNSWIVKNRTFYKSIGNHDFYI